MHLKPFESDCSAVENYRAKNRVVMESPDWIVDPDHGHRGKTGIETKEGEKPVMINISLDDDDFDQF